MLFRYITNGYTFYHLMLFFFFWGFTYSFCHFFIYIFIKI